MKRPSKLPDEWNWDDYSIQEWDYGYDKTYIILYHDDTGISTEGYDKKFFRQELIDRLWKRLQNNIRRADPDFEFDDMYEIEFEADFEV